MTLFASAQPIIVDADSIRRLDLGPLSYWSKRPLAQILSECPALLLEYKWPLEEDDPRELAECPEPRLWTLRADGRFPWLPLLLERKQGSLIRYAAMVIPHYFSHTEGLRFNSQALELWITHRLMLLDGLAKDQDLSLRGNLGQMAIALGFDLEPSFWRLLD
ncbi:hypothetical protein OMCYN_00195 [cyanobiont of Ornithocercus magnificus]|nr:hypothetical protein OMCYN_00195 [cyanobiont of Ornithocercus magnificus]